MFKPIQTALAAATLVATLAIAPAASAETAQLSFRDLDLATQAGQQELSRRIETAARRACDVEAPTGTRIRSSRGLAECMADVRRQVETRLAKAPTSEQRGR